MLFRSRDRRYPNEVAGFETVLGIHASGVHAYLSRANQTVYVAARDPLQGAQQKVVEPLARRFGVDFLLSRLRPIAGRRGIFLRRIQGRTN